MNLCQARLRLVQAGAAIAAAALVAGCGNTYRPVITPVNPSGPPAQPQAWAVVVSAPSPSAPGIATIIDYSGDTIMAEAPIGPAPSTFGVDASGGTSYTLSLTDASNPADSFATTQTCVPAGTCQNSTAEWIAERPVTNIGVSPLASFFHWDVATASQTSDGVPGSISAGPDATQVTMMDGTFSYPLVGISRLSRGGDEFSARWLNSY